VEEMVRTGFHVAARSNDEAIIGHAALFRINQYKCEMLVAVSPEFHNMGIGTELVRACIDMAVELGFDRIWLPVDATNVRARHVYEKCGFEYASSSLGREVDMLCDLRSRRCAPAGAGTSCGAAPIPAPLFLSQPDASLTHVP
jgi:N-acetylglutamate synthase-like GNAT family acetyltransferase